MKPNQIICGNNIEVVKSWPPNCVDAIVTDPPYELGFMGKSWDSSGIAYSVPMWKQMLRITKPGGFLLCFGGTRTYHRLACAIEDAGWEIRDCMMWLYGSGFPKSHNISKAIDKAKGAERTEVIGSRHRNVKPYDDKVGWNQNDTKGDHNYTAPATDLAHLWDGYGTALKPAHEEIIIAQKPLTYKEFTDIIAHKIKEILCQLKLYAKTVRKNSLLNPVGRDVVMCDSALWTAVQKCNTPADLLGLMDTLPSESEIPLSLSIGLLWLNTLAVIYSQANTFTTETVVSLTTDLKILNSLLSTLTPAFLIQVATGQLGIGSNAEVVASIFTVARMKLKGIPDVSAQDNVTLRPEYEPIIVAMKPLDGTFAQNAERHGVAGLNIDGGRITKSAGDRTEYGINDIERSKNNNVYGKQSGRIQFDGTQGRWPANLILECICDEVVETDKTVGRESGYDFELGNQNNPARNITNIKSGVHYKDKVRVHTNPDCPCTMLDEQTGKLTSGGGIKVGKRKKQATNFTSSKNYDNVVFTPDSGGASRFFKQIEITIGDLIWNGTFVNYAEKLLWNIEATIESIVPSNVWGWHKELKDLNAKFVEKKLGLCEIYTALVLAGIKNLGSNQEALQTIQDSIGNCNECIQILNLVLSVVNWENTDIIQITINLLKSCGYVRPAIKKCTQKISPLEPNRFIYVPKTSRKERNIGLEDLKGKSTHEITGRKQGSAGQMSPYAGVTGNRIVKNTHPTVKPLALMKYLCTLLKMPSAEQVILDPFLGSGTTGMACRELGINFVGIEKEPEYCEIAVRRIAAVEGRTCVTLIELPPQTPEERQEHFPPAEVPKAIPHDEHRQSIINAASAGLRRNRK